MQTKQFCLVYLGTRSGGVYKPTL